MIFALMFLTMTVAMMEVKYAEQIKPHNQAKNRMCVCGNRSEFRYLKKQVSMETFMNHLYQKQIYCEYVCVGVCVCAYKCIHGFSKFPKTFEPKSSMYGNVCILTWFTLKVGTIR